MKINELMLRDVRATIETENGNIIINNPKGDTRKELLMFFENQLEKNMDNASKKKGRKKKIANDKEILVMLINKLTNIEVDEDIDMVINNPSHEMNMVMLYLASIMQELIFEVMANYNLDMRMKQNTIIEKDTVNRIFELENLIKEIKQRKLIEDGKEVL